MKRLSLARSLIIVICVLQFRLCTITTANGHNESSRSTSSKTLPSSQIAEVYSSSKPTIANQDPVTEKHSVKNDSNKANRHQLQHRKQDCRIKINDEQSQMHADGGKELPEISAAMNADEDKFIQASRIVLDNDVRTLNSYSVGEAILMFLVTIVHSSAYHVLYTHRYDNYNDMKLASGPSVNNELCLKQLEDMYSRDERLNRDGLNSTDANLYQILNTWGRAPSGFTLVDMFFEGSYEECLRSKLVSNGEQTGGVDMRYCVMSFKSKDWPQLDKHDLLSIKTAVCIPKTCDSADHRNKYELIWALASRQLGPMSVEDSWKMTGLYCLPDHNSPLRSIRHSPKARIAATCFILWLALLVYATYKYNKIEQRMKLEEANKNLIDDNSSYSESRVKIFRILSITNNLKLLFSTKKESTIVESSSPSSSSATQIKSKEDQASITPEANHESQREMVQASAGVTSKCENQDRFIDLGCIEGIKVIAMCYIIMGHVVMCMTTVMSNGRDLTENVTGPLVFFLANLVPAFAVNSFFTITGLLTSYLLFKQNKTQPLITSASKWIAIIVFRYLRIMPMYALAVLYCKTLAKYTGSGPLWDYGTSSVSQRHNCEQEPWHWTLTFTSNFLSPMQHCIPGGWYLSNDFQFMLVTPIFMVTLYLKPRFGKALLYVSIIAGYLAGFMSIYSSQTTDLISIAKILPFGFKTYVSHLSFNYTHPQYRIPAYLIGLLIGHKLYHFEEMKKRHAQLSELERSHQPAPCWSDSFKRYGAYSAAVLIAACCMTPLLACRLPFTKDAARFMVSLVTPSYHIFYAFAVGTFIMLATTGHGNRYLTRFLASPHWKPLARLSLCAVLVNVEVINYFVQSSTRQQHITNGYLILLNTICILGTYLAATVACVLFEAPIRSGLNATLAGLMKSMSNKQKQKIR